VERHGVAGLARSNGTPLLIGFWHGQYFPLLPLLRGIRGQVFIGEGFRGSLIAAIGEAFGYTPILLPHGQRQQAVERMRAALASPLPCATAFDGPLGPARQVKVSLIRLASEVGATILPVSVSTAHRCVLGWRWDRREIPYPFAKVQLLVGSPLAIPRGLPANELADWQQRVKSSLDEL